MDIVLATFNARFSHSALSLRCLRANLGRLRPHSAIIEFENRIAPGSAVEALLQMNPRVVLFSVYIWNLTLTSEVAAILKRLRPKLKIVVGGPEVSHDGNASSVPAADCRVCGEAEAVVEPLCAALLNGEPVPSVVTAPPPALDTVALPYAEYSANDIANRRIYVESSRGCPFHCDYCLSSLDDTVRFFPLDTLLPAFQELIDRGARVFKFLDRSFNIHPAHAGAILDFFLARQCEGMMLHLEWEPDLLPAALLDRLAAAPPGFFQIEAGVQTFHPDVAARIHRRLHPQRLEAHLKTLAALPSVHLHADLIAGLPGETLEQIAQGFDRLHACHPQEIQLGILKRLKGAPIESHTGEWQMVYNPAPPYDVLQTATLSFNELQRIRRFARYWDLIVNSGRFARTAPLLWQDRPSVFAAFLQWSDWLYARTGTTFGFSPARLSGLLDDWLTGERAIPSPIVTAALQADEASRAAPIKGMERQGRAMSPRAHAR